MSDLDRARQVCRQITQRNLVRHYLDEATANREMALRYPQDAAAVAVWQQGATDCETTAAALELLPRLVALAVDQVARIARLEREVKAKTIRP